MTKNEKLILELQSFLIAQELTYSKEVVFSLIMPTKRKFRADFYIPSLKTIIEINGGQFSGGRHNRGGIGYENDLTKSNIASLNGVFYLQYTYQMLNTLQYQKDILLIKSKNTIKNLVK